MAPRPRRHVADWHLRLRETITDDQRLAVLRIKDAVLQDGVRTLEQFAHWLATHASH